MPVTFSCTNPTHPTNVLPPRRTNTSKPGTYKMWVNVMLSYTGGTFEQLLPTIASGGSADITFNRTAFFISSTIGNRTVPLLPSNL